MLGSGRQLAPSSGPRTLQRLRTPTQTTIPASGTKIRRGLNESRFSSSSRVHASNAKVPMKTASEEVTDMIFLNKWGSQTLCAGAELGVFDFLFRDATRTAGKVATETGLDPTLLYRLLRALASLGLLDETPGHRFSLTDRGAVLRTD